MRLALLSLVFLACFAAPALANEPADAPKGAFTLKPAVFSKNSEPQLKTREFELGYTFFQGAVKGVSARAGLLASGDGLEYNTSGYMLHLVQNF